MSAPVELGYGAWPSPIAAQDLVVGAAGLSEAIGDGADVWFNESRPSEGGRVALMRWRDGEISEMTGPDVNGSLTRLCGSSITRTSGCDVKK